MIVTLLIKVFLLIASSFDMLLHAVLPTTFISGMATATVLVFGTMAKVSLYLFALFPITVGMIYGWLFIYFQLWLIQFCIGFVMSFIPRHTLVR